MDIAKKYFLGIGIMILMASCSQKTDNKQARVEDTVKSYISGQLHDSKEYQPISFSNIDSMRLGDTPLYRETERQKEELENFVVALRQETRAIDEAGQRDINHLYTESANQLVTDEYRLQEMEKRLKEWENNRNDYVYTIRHKYRIQDVHNPREYENNFYVDKNFRVMEAEPNK